MSFYDGTKLLSLRDINRKRPEIYISTTNRNAGKTTFFNRMLMNKFVKRKEKFCLVYRYNYELDDCGSKFFKSIGKLFFNNHEVHSKMHSDKTYAEIYFDGDLCGYGVSLNKSNEIKKCSHLLSDTKYMLFDEFQPENNRYLKGEVKALMSIHTSLAREEGKQVKYLPLYMISNTVSIANPYFLAMGITNLLRSNTKYLRGDGFVLEQSYYEDVANMQLESGFNRALSSDSYVAYASQNVYLNDNTTFIDKPSGASRYICTIVSDKNYSIRYYVDIGLYFMDKTYDRDNKTQISFETKNHNSNTILATASSNYGRMLKELFEKGMIRFSNYECKNVFITLLKYNVV